MEERGTQWEYEVQALVESNSVGFVEHHRSHSKLAMRAVSLVDGSVLIAGLGSVVCYQEGQHSGDLLQTCCSCPTILTGGGMT